MNGSIKIYLSDIAAFLSNEIMANEERMEASELGRTQPATSDDGSGDIQVLDDT